MKKQIFTILLTVAFSISTFPFTASAEDTTIYIEAEDAVLQGALSVTEDTEASNHAAVGVFQNTDDSIVFTVEIPESGSYNLIFNSKGIGGEKQNRVLLDGTYFSDFSSTGDTYSEDTIQNVYIEEGIHQISIEKSWGWIWLDYLKIQKDSGISDSVYHVNDQLVNENADANTQQLFSYLCSIYGKQILSGQVCNDGLQGDEFQAIYKETGKYPAILGLDMMDYCQARIENGAESHAVETAIDFHNQGGIVEFHWHWNAPNCYLKDGTTSDGNPRWWGGFYTDNTTLDITKILDGSDATAKELIDTMFKNMTEKVFPFIKEELHAGKDTAFSKYMKDALFLVPTARVLVRVVDALDSLDLHNKDIMGDVYEYLLSQMATSGTNGQFRTPRHIIKMMAELMEPTLEDSICDPAMGSAGFICAAAAYVSEKYKKELMKTENKKHYTTTMFSGFDTDQIMLRIGAMNMMLHGVEAPNIDWQDSLSEDNTHREEYPLIMAIIWSSKSIEMNTFIHSFPYPAHTCQIKNVKIA